MYIIIHRMVHETDRITTPRINDHPSLPKLNNLIISILYNIYPTNTAYLDCQCFAVFDIYHRNGKVGRVFLAPVGMPRRRYTPLNFCISYMTRVYHIY